MTFDIFLGSFFDYYWIIYQITILCLEINCFFSNQLKFTCFIWTLWLVPDYIEQNVFHGTLDWKLSLSQVNKTFSSGKYCYSIKTLENYELNEKKFYSILLKSVWLLAHFNVVWHSVIVCTIGEGWRRKKDRKLEWKKGCDEVISRMSRLQLF